MIKLNIRFLGVLRLLIVFFLLWIIFNGKLTVEIAIFGVIISTAVYGFCCKYMGYDPKTDVRIVKKFYYGIEYVAVLVWETVKSNIAVSKIVFARKIHIEPRIVYFTTDLKSDAARIALANSITLTPGTITVAVSEDKYCIHCLNGKLAEGLEDSNFVKRLRKFEDRSS